MTAELKPGDMLFREGPYGVEAVVVTTTPKLHGVALACPYQQEKPDIVLHKQTDGTWLEPSSIRPFTWRDTHALRSQFRAEQQMKELIDMILLPDPRTEEGQKATAKMFSAVKQLFEAGYVTTSSEETRADAAKCVNTLRAILPGRCAGLP
jgi:hypothetical protein